MAATLALSYERCGGEALIGSIAWERYVVDPLPGPIAVDELVNTVEKGEGYAIVDRWTFALRGGRVVIPQAVNVSIALGRRVFVLDITRGPRGLARTLEQLKNMYGIDTIIGVDVGGDAIAEGLEESLWSPLADAIVAAALAHIEGSLIAISSPGADGELPPEYVERRIRRIARLGGYVGGYILSQQDLEVLKRILGMVVSEASSVPLRVLDTDLDMITIRKESRAVRISLMNLAVFLLDAIRAVRDSLARYVYDTSSFNEARWILNKLTIATEYDVEEEVFKELASSGSYTSLNLVRIRNDIRKRLAMLHIALPT